MDSVLSLLGLVYRAKKVVLGESVLESISKINFLFIASDASDKTKERYLKKCYFYKIPYSVEYNSDELSNAIGKSNCKIIGINNRGFAKSIQEKITKEG